ncbi:Cytochrome P450 4V2 [Holothuria leucospilota]|uniref:Cytochrome P450 4V2 n=1 Tax=Holothuria leucospilota TaxID=206669 RepID=A0A9Q1BDA5_HOLLE|nr:Cytochrome P450 4V2 [Holothuria leucospilota]
MAIGIGLTFLLVMSGFMVAYLFVRRMKLWFIMSHFEPGPPGLALPLIGHAYMFPRDPIELYKTLRRWYVERAFASPEKRNRVTWIGPEPVIFVVNPKDLETILSSSKQLEKGHFYRMLMPWLGDGLLVSKGKKWQKRRKLLTPSFHFSVLASFIDIFNEQAQILTKKFESLGCQKSVDIFTMVTCCTLDVICATAMGKNVGAQRGNNKEYVQAILEMSDLIQERQKYPWLWIDAIYRLIPAGKKHNHYVKILHNMTKSVIYDRLGERHLMKQNSSSKSVGNGSVDKRKRMAFLDLLLELHEEDNNFTIDDVREEVDTFMFEGHDTTAAAISWTLFMMGHHPEVQEKVQKELDEVFGCDRDRSITYDDIQKLHYLGCVIKETLRLYPSVPRISRQLQEDAVIGGNFVPKGTLIVIGVFPLHRNPDHFPNPDEFNPDNFLPENLEGRNPFVYIPFSAGPRNCIGQRFAVMEEKVILATLLRKLKFRSIHSVDDVVPIGNLILRPFNGIMMEVTPR